MCKINTNENATTLSDLQGTNNATTTSRKLIQDFNKCHAHWGIDKAVVGGYHYEIYDKDKFNKKKDADKIKLSGLTTIIHDKRFGEMKHGHIRKKDYENNYCDLSLIEYGNNSITTNVYGLKKRIETAKRILFEEYGILLHDKDLRLKDLEIAFTVAYKDPIPDRVAEILTYFNVTNGRSLNSIKPRQSNDDYLREGWTFSAENLKSKTTSSSYVFYDKSTEILKHDKIETRPYCNIYRYEIRLHTIDKIYQSLLDMSTPEGRAYENRNSVHFDGIDCLSDTHILNFIRKHIDMLHDQYIKGFLESKETIEETISELKANNCGKANAILIGLSVLNQILYTGVHFPFDIECFLYCFKGVKNGNKKAEDIIRCLSREKEKTPLYRLNVLSRMDGWLVEDIINDMLQAYQNGLGMNTSQINMQIPPLYYPNNKDKEEYLQYLGSRKKPRLKAFEMFQSKASSENCKKTSRDSKRNSKH